MSKYRILDELGCKICDYYLGCCSSFLFISLLVICDFLKVNEIGCLGDSKRSFTEIFFIFVIRLLGGAEAWPLCISKSKFSFSDNLNILF